MQEKCFTPGATEDDPDEFVIDKAAELDFNNAIITAYHQPIFTSNAYVIAMLLDFHRSRKNYKNIEKRLSFII